MVLPRSFYLHPDVVTIARELLGKYLVTCMDGIVTSGMICETEAYAGITDRASHAFGGRRSQRTEIMYCQGGTAYVYFCYGVHSLFNVVTNKKDIPHAVLIRGIIPADGKEFMLRRAGKGRITKDFGIGPGKVAKILGIHYSHTGLDLTIGNEKSPVAIWIEDRGVSVDPYGIISGPRIGVSYAGENALLPYRFHIRW
ncbi:MAG: DNA-3-methyladenine glycosylase [Bacteroidales bacterium]|jgi:DNA-3-methyladenine glycosylase|nr:DNA-3-methyladenine glycosylase [Bacteroidales bacterium]